MKLLLINPNSSRHITERLCAEARIAAGAGVAIEGVNPERGPAAIRSKADNDAATATVLALARAHLSDHHGVILGVSMDTALPALRGMIRVPVVGMAQGGLTAACMLHDKVAALTLGAQMVPLYEALTAEYGFASRVVRWRALEIPSAFEHTGTDADTAEQLVAACGDLVAQEGAGAILLCGAVLSGYGRMIAPRLAVPVVDAIAAATLQVMALVRMQRLNDTGAIRCELHLPGQK